MQIKTRLEFNHDGTYTTIRDSDGVVVKDGARELKEAQEACGSAPGTYRIKQPDIIGILTVDVMLDAPPEEPPPEEPPVEPEPPPEPPPVGTNPFNALYPVDFRLPAMAADPIPSVTRPPKSSGLADAIIDATYKTRVYRVADAVNEGSRDQLRQDYSRRQALNADKTRLILIDGTGSVYLYDARTFKKLKVLPGIAGGDSEPLWHPTNPRLLRHTAYTGGRRWYELDVESGVRTVLFDFAEVTPWPDATRYWTKAEGSFSADGRYICLMAMTDSYAMRGIVCVDMVEGRIVGAMTTSERPDHVGMSASGHWCIVSGAQTVAWPRDFDAPASSAMFEKEPMARKLAIATAAAEAMRADPENLDVVDDWDEAAATNHVLYQRSEHSDIGFDKDGRDAIVHAVFAAGPNEGWIVCTDIETGVHTRVVRIYDDNHGSTTVHISCQCFDRRGWCVVSAYDDFSNYSHYPANPLQPLHRKVSLHRMDGATSYSVAHIHGDKRVGNAYYHEPQATISRDGSRIVFASSYSNPGPSAPGQPEAYMIGLPDSVYQ